ncbi:MAG TPA: AraC family transcriptional regulator [Vicinamibacteria bacterium]|nr:AraC family transcriptional regulator [Vicinamibacteria bacterium]
MDVLSDVLRVVRLTSAVFFTARFSSPWSIESPPPDQLARSLRLRAESIALFHVLVEGQCWISFGDQAPTKMEAGDVLIFPRGDPHVMSSHVGARPCPIGSLLPSQPSEEIPQLHYGGGGETTRWVCGFLHCDQAFNPLIGALPTMLCVRGRESTGQGLPPEAQASERAGVVLVEADGWLATTLQHTIEEADATHPGGSAMLARLIELLYLDVLRRYMQQLPSGHTGWLAGVKDPEVGRALRLLHARPDHPWTVEDLAHEVGVSRSALAQRFTELTGEAPMRYLTGWRIQLAKHLMLQASLAIAEVADRVGYESEAAFNRAFKRRVGVPPAKWRKGFDSIRKASE